MADKVGINQYEQVNRFSLCMQLAGHFIGNHSAIAKAT